MLLPFFEWCESLWLGRAVVGSLWLFPVIEAVHLLALSVLGGAILIVDLRLLGTGLKDWTPAELWRESRPYLIGAIAALILTGVPLFLSEAIKCYYNTSFWVKISTLPVALLFTLVVKARYARTAGETTTVSRFIGATSLLLWFIVAAGGRWIGFS
jgi:hypothetical protein